MTNTWEEGQIYTYRCSEIPELVALRDIFEKKYGRDFVSAAADLRPNCGVNCMLIDKLSVRSPSGEVKLKIMKEIAEDYQIDWDTTETENVASENANVLVTQMNFFATPPLTETVLPFYQSSSPICLDPKPSSLNNYDSGLTCNNIPPSSAAPRKHQRDSMMMMMGDPHHHHEFNTDFIPSQNAKLSGSFLPLLDSDIVSQI
ncbi:hypothetical protein FEM48_ZijujUnG0102400 [Ziziphus jujuba var. spinosa]|uniref:Uncharacterized protein n=1 Tax=Ziziphus jujuba var. spinosa TaxID=714518 RepID=A0A978U887_ZIZJJ|nr:hypothetical protein FEM48_ZijujUnG0102400 [Ziziphus jujuba var. spinosa]